jgi:hypothetical protein
MAGNGPKSMADTEFGSFGGSPIQSASQEYQQELAKDDPDPTALAQIAMCNSYRCPRGARPGEAWLLMLGSDVQTVSSTTTGASPYSPLILGCGQNQLSAPNMVFLEATQIHGSAPSDPNALFLVHAADERSIGMRRTFVKAYNTRTLGDPAAEYWSETEDPNAATLYNGTSGPGRGPWTWQKMLNDIWDYATPAPVLTGLTFPTSNPERFRFIEDSNVAAYSEAVRSIFCELVYNPMTTDFSVVQLGQADEYFQQLQQSSQSTLLFATNPNEADPAWFPASVDAVFLAVYSGAPEESVTTAPYYILNLTPTAFPNSAVPIPDTTDVIFCPLDAQMCCPGQQPTNQTALQALGQLLVNSYYQARDQAERPKTWVYSGISAFLPGSQVGEVIWHLGPNGTTTTVNAVAGT